jgi:hypothetical protein
MHGPGRHTPPRCGSPCGHFGVDVSIPLRCGGRWRSGLAGEAELNAARTSNVGVGLMLTGPVWVPAAGTTGAEAVAADCVKPTGVQRIVFSARKYPNVRRHYRARFGAAGPAAWWSTVAGRMPDANERCATSRRVRASTATSTPQRSAGAAGRGSRVAATRAAGRPMCATCPAPRTDHTARPSETDSNHSATAPASATCSADSLLRGEPLLRG